MEPDPVDLGKFDPVNRRHMRGFIRHLELKGVTKSTISAHSWKVFSFLRALGFLDVMTLTRRDIEDYVIRRQQERRPATVQGEMVSGRLFLTWLRGPKGAALFKGIRLRIPKRTLPTEAVLTEEDVKKLLKFTDTSRDRALIMTFWDSGARLAEVLALNIGHVQPDKYGATIIVTGKTGMRRIRLIDAVPDLQAWLNQHPLREDPAAPLFVTVNVDPPRRLASRSAHSRLQVLAKRAGITKRVNPHGLRHGKMTSLTREGFTEADLQNIAGWVPGSRMSAVYVHLSGRDVDEKILRKRGLLKDEPPREDLLRSRECPRCKNQNPPDALFCTRCSMVLSQEALKELDQLRQLTYTPDQLDALAAEMRKKGSLPVQESSSTRRPESP